MSKARRKGTGAETELRNILLPDMPGLVRTPPSSIVDLRKPGYSHDAAPLFILATRPDYGRWLLTMNVEDFLHLWRQAGSAAAVEIECKRYAKFAHHGIYETKFGARG